MVTTAVYTDACNRALIGTGYDGVVRVTVGSSYGTGVLLYDGRAILTAAHLFADGMATTNVQFETTAGSQTITASGITVSPLYESTDNNNDLAIVWLSATAPAEAERYSLYRESDEIGQCMTMVGYGLSGNGSTGYQSTSSIVRLKAENQFDADTSTLKAWLGSAMGWTSTPGTQLLADFDDGNTTHDALGWLINQAGSGLGQSEGLVAPGDSGGPAFINGQIAGITSYTARLERNGIVPDIDSVSNSSYGEIASWTRCSAYQQWIDQSIRASYENAPASASEVQLRITEGHSGTTLPIFCFSLPGCEPARTSGSALTMPPETVQPPQARIILQRAGALSCIRGRIKL